MKRSTTFVPKGHFTALPVIRQAPVGPNIARPYVFKAKALLIEIKRSTAFGPKGHFTALPVI